MSQVEDSDYDDLCLICFNKWTKEGVHMATRLPCGHIFGFRCLNQAKDAACNCPVCNGTFYKHELEGVYQSLETYNDSSSTSVDEDPSPGIRRNAKSKRKAARAKKFGDAAAQQHG